MGDPHEPDDHDQQQELESDELTDRGRRIDRQPCAEPRRRLVESRHENAQHEDGHEPLESTHDRPHVGECIAFQRGNDNHVMPDCGTDPKTARRWIYEYVIVASRCNSHGGNFVAPTYCLPR